MIYVLRVGDSIWYTRVMTEFHRNSMALLLKSERYPHMLWVDLDSSIQDSLLREADAIVGNKADDTKDVHQDT